MSQFSEANGLPDKEINDLFDELNREDKLRRDEAARLGEFDDRAMQALDESGYEPLLENSPRYVREYQAILDYFHQNAPLEADADYSLEPEVIFNQNAKRLLAGLARREADQITRIKMTAAQLEGYKVTNAGLQDDRADARLSAEAIRVRKKQLAAWMYEIEEMVPTSVLFSFMDSFVPGGPVDVEADDMEPYYDQARQDLQRRVQWDMEYQALVDRVCQATGLDLPTQDPASQERRAVLTEMVSIGLRTDLDGRANFQAQREGEIYELARAAGIDEATTKLIIDFLKTQSPPEI